MFRLETHCHTAESSPCGKVPAAALVGELKSSGFDGVVITDHFTEACLDRFPSGWPQRMDAFLAGYRTALCAGKEAGLRVFCGIEFRSHESSNDYLVFGVTPQFLYEHPELPGFTVAQLRRLADDTGLLVVQAHPFRDHMTREDPALLDGVEVYNGNARHDSRNGLALRFARENGLLMFSGSDHHQTEDRGRGGMVLPREPRDEADLVRLLPRGGLLPDILTELFPPKAED